MATVAEPQFFIVIGTQRTGTNLLRDILNSNDQLCMVAEILIPYPDRCHWNEFLPSLPEGWYPAADEAAGMRLLDRYFAYFLNEIRTCYDRKGQAIALGVDIKLDQLALVEPASRPPEALPFLIDYARARGFVLINTVRDNVVQCMISYLIGLQRNFWHNYEGRVIEGGYRLDIPECLAFARGLLAQQAAFEKATEGQPVIRLRYEDLASAVAETGPGRNLCGALPVLGEIAQALGIVPAFHYDGRLQKATNRPYGQIIANHQELVAALVNSEFAPWVESIR